MVDHVAVAPLHTLARVAFLHHRLIVALLQNPAVALALRRAPAVRLRRAGDCRLERHLAVALAQRQHRLGAVEVAALRHAADKVRVAVLHSPGDHLAQPRLEPQAAFVALVRPPRQLRRAVTREAAAHRFSAHPHSSPRRFLFIIEHSFLFVKYCFFLLHFSKHCAML